MYKISFNKKYFVLWMIIVLALNYSTFYKASSTTTNTSKTTTLKVWTWTIKSSIETNWSAELVNEQSIRFTQTWKVESVSYKAWDKVKKWDIIATLDNTDWKNSVKQAQISLDNAKIALEELYKEADASKISQAKNAITSTEQSIEVAKKELENLNTTKTNWLNDIKNNISNLQKELEQSKANLEALENELNSTKATQDNSLTNTTTQNQNSIKQIQNNYQKYLTEIHEMLEKIDTILWVTSENDEKNDSYEIYLWAKNVWVKNQAISSFSTANANYITLKAKVDAFDYDSLSIDKNIELINDFTSLYNNIISSSDLTYQTASNSLETDTLSSSDVSSIKSTMTNYKSTSLNEISTLSNNISTLKTLTNTDLIKTSNENTITSKKQNIESTKLSITKKEQEITDAQENYKTQEKSYDLQIQSKKNSIEQLEKNLEVNKQSYDELLEWPTDENVTKAKNSIKQAEMSLESAKKWLEKYQLEAPFDWVIRKIDYKVWDNLLSDSDKYVYIENPNLMQITVSLDQVDIINVKLWDKVIVTFDSYADDEVNAVVSTIDTTPTTTSWVVSYEVTIVLDDENFKKTVLSWMTADIEIITAQKDNAIVIDSSYISTDENEKSYVNVLKNGKETKTEVVTWIVSDWKTQIASGLEIWDTISLTTSSTSDSSSSKSSSSLLQMWGNKSSSSTKSSSNFGWWAWGPPGWF